MMEPPEPLNTTAIIEPTVSDLRREQYEQRSDPLFFMWQRGEASEQAWLDEVAAIRDEYPDSDPD